MKTYLSISLLTATMITGSALASDLSTLGDVIHYPANVQQPSNAPALTRAEVVAQIPAGASLGDAIDYPAGVQAQSHSGALSRAEVKAQLAHASAAGTAPNGGIHYPASF